MAEPQIIRMIMKASERAWAYIETLPPEQQRAAYREIEKHVSRIQRGQKEMLSRLRIGQKDVVILFGKDDNNCYLADAATLEHCYHLATGDHYTFPR